MKILIIGATGLIGSKLCPLLVKSGHELILFSRNAIKAREMLKIKAEYIDWKDYNLESLSKYIEETNAIINLAGENLGSGRWTNERKRKIIESRVKSVNSITTAIRETKNKPEVYIQASAIGYYGTSLSSTFDELSPNGQGFLAEVCRQWEEPLETLNNLTTRIIVLRSGVVIDKTGGALKQMMLPFKMFFGGYLGSGNQWISWVHIEDEVRAILFLLQNQNTYGVFNITSPNPLVMSEFSKTIGMVMNRTSWFHVPSFILKTFFGEMAEGMVLSGQKVIPKRLLEAGYKFKFEDLEMALRDLIMNDHRGLIP